MGDRPVCVILFAVKSAFVMIPVEFVLLALGLWASTVAARALAVAIPSLILPGVLPLGLGFGLGSRTKKVSNSGKGSSWSK